MKTIVRSAALGAALVLGVGSAAHAADVTPPVATKAPPAAAAPAGPSPCANMIDFFTTSCYLGGAGLTLYGAIDVGYGWQSHGAPFNEYFVTGASYFMQKVNDKPLWSLAPNGMSQSFIGIKLNSPIVPGPTGVSLVAAVEMGFDPYSLQFANSPGSMVQNIGIPGPLQSTNGDSSRAGQWDNGQAFAGFSSPTWGTLTAGRQNTLALDVNNAYDPLGASYAFSPIGFSGQNGGFGFTQNARFNTSIKYRVNVGWFRAAGEYQWGGYEQGNATTGAWQVNGGGDIPLSEGWGRVSFDVVYGRSLNAEFLTLPVSANPALNQLIDTLANIDGLMLGVKYTNGPLNLYFGYSKDYLSDPSACSGQTNCLTQITTLNNFTIIQAAIPNPSGGKTTATITTNKYVNGAETLQSVWGGFKYNVTPTLDLLGGYYHFYNNNYDGYTTAGNCPQGNNSSKCAGSTDAASAAIDWRFAPKWDAYFGIMWSQLNGGQQNGGLVGLPALARNNIDPTAGVRFRF